ncbi:MAG: AAA family ATPase [Clostridia bacterium BRH_c25]|nr:MAG: AAA family ATPase [Clostridia bacterium BRH_c25]
MGYNNEAVRKVEESVSKAIVGKKSTVEKLLVALLAGGHVLIEDVPGVGKTTLVHAVARSIGCSFKRIQFTPDLLPSDITGVTVYNMKLGEFEFKQGPITSNIVLADEINRGSPKTQSSLLEAMQERQITVDGNTYKLPEPFMVLATQNPIEYEGTFPLPEAQIDRFTIRISMGYPTYAEEKSILDKYRADNILDSIEPVIGVEDVMEIRKKVEKVHVDDSILDYIVMIVQATRDHKDVYLGCSPRGTLALYNNSRAMAFIRGREYVLPDDVKELVFCTLAHRIILKSEARIHGKDQNSVLADVLKNIKVPVANING